MDNALFVDIVNCGGEFRKPLKNAVLVQFGGLDVGKRMGIAVFRQDHVHHEVQDSGLLVEVQVEDMDEIRIAKPRQHLSFRQKLAFQRFDMTLFERKGLQRVMDAQLHMLDFIDRTNSALAKKADDAISSKLLPWLHFHFNSRRAGGPAALCASVLKCSTRFLTRVPCPRGARAWSFPAEPGCRASGARSVRSRRASRAE